MEIKLHSFTDLITNSSTTIYTFSDGSEQVLASLINEICNTFGLKERCEDMFVLTVMPTDNDRIEYWIADNHDQHPEIPPELYGRNAYAFVGIFVNRICDGSVEKPAWFDKMLKDILKNNKQYGPGTTLHVTPKDPKYQKIAKLVVEFLYSTESLECAS